MKDLTMKLRKERKETLKRILHFFPDLFEKLELEIAESDSFSSEIVRNANEQIFNYCMKNGINYSVLALMPDIL